MAPNPIMLPRRRRLPHEEHVLAKPQEQELGMTWTVLSVAVTVLLFATASWPRKWLLSGCAIESHLIIAGASQGTRIFPSVPLWTLLASLNLIYAVGSTSWLLYMMFTAACWPFILITSLSQFQLVAAMARRNLRALLRDISFTRDRIALFNLPALEIDTEVSGLMVIRGATISLSDLTVVAHGVEVGIKLTEDIELALYVDEVKVSLLRSISVGDVYGNVKGGAAEMTFANIEEESESTDADDASLFNETPLIRAATMSSEGMKLRPKLGEVLTGGSYLKDTSPGTLAANIKTLSPDEQAAEQKYLDMLDEIRTSSAVYQSRARVRKAAREKGNPIEDEKDLRAAVCAELHEFPSVPHPPSYSVRVTTLQNMSTPATKRFLHRLPFLLRLLLNMLAYFHPVKFNSISAAGSGSWMKQLLQTELFKHYTEGSKQLRRIERRIMTWLEDANFCVQLTDIDGLGSVPLSTSIDIVSYLHFNDILAYRTLPLSGILTQVVRLGGADATILIPSFLLPHHEHVLPPTPSADDLTSAEEEVEQAEGLPRIVQAQKDLARVEKDETTLTISAHASLPAAFDQELLMFVAALVKATKIIEFDKEVERLDSLQATENLDTLSPSSTMDILTPTSDTESLASLTRVSTDDTLDSVASAPAPINKHSRVQSDLTSLSSGKQRFKTFTKNLQQNLREASLNTAATLNKESIRNFMQEVHQSTKDGMKKAVVGSMVNDRWIAKMVGKVAANLERASGQVGYEVEVPIELAPYRPGPESDGHLSKLLP